MTVSSLRFSAEVPSDSGGGAVSVADGMEAMEDHGQLVAIVEMVTIADHRDGDDRMEALSDGDSSGVSLWGCHRCMEWDHGQFVDHRDG
jgi:hypothetical protein